MKQEEKFLKVARLAVKKGEPIFLKCFGKPEEVSVKAGASPTLVTEADGEIEKIISAEISREFPSHAIVGEEGSPKKGDSPYTWYLDPIDGTTNFSRGFSPCVISAGLFDGEGPLVAVISDPVCRNEYYAIRGGGAFKNGKPIGVSKVSSFNMLVGGFGWKGQNGPKDGAELLKKILKVTRTARVLGSHAMQLAMVAEGVLDCFAANGTSIWDVAAGLLLVSEAGGKVTDWSGAPFVQSGQSIVGSNGIIHEALLKVLG
jgi:myo-inositol-1(or 4)-monophosphatase